jgi:FKBP-type peptidyl-prolyl cis-trans isomerase
MTNITKLFALVALIAAPFSSLEAGAEALPAAQVVTTPSGLKYTDDVVGKGAVAEKGKKVTVNYTGWVQKDNRKGTKFDSSREPGRQPFTFDLGGGRVIKGWDEGVVGMREGGTRTLIIPADLAYGAGGKGPVIGPNATLIFEVEVVKVQ